MTRTVTITSGKGGVGKTNISVNLALHLATLGYRTCLFDADLGLANINILLGLNPEYNLEDVLLHRHNLKDIIIRNYKGIDIIPGSSGAEKLANLEDEQVEHLIHSFSELDGYDFLLFDTSAGVSRNVISFCLASSEVALIITPEPTSLTDAYALLKILSLNGFTGAIKLVVNQCKNIPTAKRIYNKFKETVTKHLPINIIPLGMVVQDKKVIEAIRTQEALISLYPESNASKCIKNITKHLLENQPENLATSGMIPFWTRCMQLIKSPLNLTGFQKEEKRTEPEPSMQDIQKEPPQPVEATEQKQEAPDAVTADSDGPVTIANMEQGVYLLISRVIDSISSVSQELQLMRKAIENAGGNGFTRNGSGGGKQDVSQPRPITLDFEAFLKQRCMDTSSKGNE